MTGGAAAYANERNCGNRERHPHHFRPFISVCHCWVEDEKSRTRRVKYWETIAHNLSKAGWSWGCVSAVDSYGTIWIADAQRDDGKRFVVRADERLSAFLELELAARRA